MKAFKYKDTIDGHYAVVIAWYEEEARTKLESATSLPFVLVDEKDIEDLKPFIMVNRMLPF